MTAACRIATRQVSNVSNLLAILCDYITFLSGFCESCKPFEKGLVISAIDNKRFDKRFEGYSDESATKKKLLKDVFEEGELSCSFMMS
jgi:hypothetical protein